MKAYDSLKMLGPQLSEAQQIKCIERATGTDSPPGSWTYLLLELCAKIEVQSNEDNRPRTFRY